uniref:Kazal-like domain-containing protein n=1 Tax=Strongyloides stercoralis TaxID=6248 RepID=A0A0K0E5X8_STRER
MKIWFSLLLVVGFFLGIITAEVQFDELESLINEIDNEGTILNPRRSVKTNICEGHICGWGKECIDDGKGKPSCQCIRECPKNTNDNDKVCATNNQTFPSLCELYQQKCYCKQSKEECKDTAYSKIHLDYLGECKQIEECTDEMMEQFGVRMADWLFQVMKELKKRRELQGLEWEQLISEAENDDEKKHVYPVIWKFCDLDIKPHDKHVTHHELIPMTAFVIPMESCIKPFLESCDTDKDRTITINEWGKCLGLKDGEIQERC